MNNQIMTMITAIALFGFILFSIVKFKEPSLSLLFLLIPLMFLYDRIKDEEIELEELLK